MFIHWISTCDKGGSSRVIIGGSIGDWTELNQRDFTPRRIHRLNRGLAQALLVNPGLSIITQVYFRQLKGMMHKLCTKQLKPPNRTISLPIPNEAWPHTARITGKIHELQLGAFWCLPYSSAFFFKRKIVLILTTVLKFIFDRINEKVTI